MAKVAITNKWIEADFVEKEVTKDGDILLTARIVPYNKISRNRVMYLKEYVEKTSGQINGLYLFHNHISDGQDVLPKGEWFEAWSQDDGLYGRTTVYNTSYNKDYIEWLKNAKTIKVSLKADGEVEYAEDANGERYKRAVISEWKEISTVNIPGFMDADASFVTMAEKLLTESDTETSNFNTKVYASIATKL